MKTTLNVYLMGMIIFFLLFPLSLYSQERLYGPVQEYYRALHMVDDIRRPYLTIQSNSRNEWMLPDKHLWKDYLQEKRQISIGDTPVSVQMIEEQIGLSWNSSYPHGMNDGALWQGRGVNAWTALGTEIRIPWFRAVLDIHGNFSENRSFELVDPAFTEDFGPAGTYGYYRSSIDYPQRFGNDSFGGWGLGESEIRFDWKILTTGFGREQLWLGPAIENPIILGTNAAPFPKFDIGIRKTDTPLGPLEFIFWWGQLSESEYFDDNATNNHNMFSGTAIGWAPAFLPGLTVGINRIVLSAWENIEWSNFLTVFNPKFRNTGWGRDEDDQRASITMDWLFPSVGFNAYFEWARNDYSPNLRDNIILEPSHSQAYTIGAGQKINMNHGFLLIRGELTQLECSDTYRINSLYGYPGFYTHGIITQGHTNEGQILGAGIGTGSESHYLEAAWYHRRGMVKAFFRRISRDRDYLYANPTKDPPDLFRLNVEVTGGLYAHWFLYPGILLSAGYELSNNINRNYIQDNDVINHYLTLGLRVQ